MICCGVSPPTVPAEVAKFAVLAVFAELAVSAVPALVANAAVPEFVAKSAIDDGGFVHPMIGCGVCVESCPGSAPWARPTTGMRATPTAAAANAKMRGKRGFGTTLLLPYNGEPPI